MASSHESSQSNSRLLRQTEEDYHIPFIKYDDLRFVRHVARGGMADISLYRWQRPGNPPLNVVKKSLFRGSLTKRYADNLKKEMGILMRLEHQNIVRTFGVVETDHDFGLIMEYHPCGSCKTFFEALRDGVGERETTLDETMAPLKIEIVEEVVDGMKYLHEMKPKKVLHLDLKSDNVLLDGELHAKICDFGLSRMSTLTLLRNRTTVEMGGVAGTPGHIPPERLRRPFEKPTTKSDVYSFAILLWEILTDRMAYEELQDLDLLSHYVINQNGRPQTESIPEVFPPELVNLMKSCWTVEARDRPSFDDLQKDMMMIKSRDPEFGKRAQSSRRRTLELWKSISSSSHQDSITEPKRHTAPPQNYGTIQRHRTNGTTPSQLTASYQDSVTVPKRHSAQPQSVPILATYSDRSRLIIAEPISNELRPTYRPLNDLRKCCCRKKFLVATVVVLAIGACLGVPIWLTTGSSHSVCSTLSRPANGKSSCTDETESQNKKCTFSCDDGFSLSGEDTVICTGGKWNLEPPTCVPGL